MHAAMLAFGDLATNPARVIDLAAIGAEVEPAGVGVLGHHTVSGADEACVVGFVVPRYRKLEYIDCIAFEHVLQNRTILDPARGNGLQIAHPVVVLLDHIDFALML